MAAPEVRYRLIGPWGHFRLDAASDDEARAIAARTIIGMRGMIESHHKPCRLLRVTQEEVSL